MKVTYFAICLLFLLIFAGRAVASAVSESVDPNVEQGIKVGAGANLPLGMAATLFTQEYMAAGIASSNQFGFNPGLTGDVAGVASEWPSANLYLLLATPLVLIAALYMLKTKMVEV